MTVHELKTWPAFFERILSGEKTFEVRKDDRGFQAGDELWLREWDPDHERQRGDGGKFDHPTHYTGREARFRVGFIYRSMPGWLDCGDYVILSLVDGGRPRGEADSLPPRDLIEAEQQRDEAQEAAARLSREVAELARSREKLTYELRSLSGWVDRIRDAAGVGPETEIDDLVSAVAELTRVPLMTLRVGAPSTDDRLEQIRQRYMEFHYARPLLKVDPAGDGDVGWLIDELDTARARVAGLIADRDQFRKNWDAARNGNMRLLETKAALEHMIRETRDQVAELTRERDELQAEVIEFRTFMDRLREDLAGLNFHDVAAEAIQSQRVARVWQKGDPEPPAGVTLLRFSSPTTDGARFVKRTPEGHWWFVESPAEETDPEGWLWQHVWDVDFQHSLTEVVHADDCQGCEQIPGAVHCAIEVIEGGPELNDQAKVPPGPYAKGGRSPIVWVLLCAVCAGYAPQTDEDYQGFLSGQCQGCGAHVRELHRFRAWIDSAAGCHCSGSHPQVVGNVRVVEKEWTLEELSLSEADRARLEQEAAEATEVIEDGDSNAK